MKKQTLKQRTTALEQLLTTLVDSSDQSVMQIVKRLSHHLALCEHAQEIMEEEGLLVEGKFGLKQNPAVNIGYNATQSAIRLFKMLDLGKEVESEFLDLD